MSLAEIIKEIPPSDKAAMTACRRNWNNLAKPIGSLGRLEDLIVQLAGITGTDRVRLDRRAVLVLCADNGVVAEGVTQSGQDVTTLIAGNMARGESSVCRMAAAINTDVVPVDIGMTTPAAGVADHHILRGTRNMVKEPAMSRQEAEAAILLGIRLVDSMKHNGYQIIATGEMGIGNTTTSSAVASVLLNRPPEEVTGVGAGLSPEGLTRKINAIRNAISLNKPDASDPLDVLSKVGGLDIAGMVGIYIGGALYGVPILIDGFISAVAALAAARLCPACRQAMICTHVSSEPAAKWVLEALSFEPLITAELRLGEGSGAVCALPLLDMALAVYNEMVTFDETGLEHYDAALVPGGGKEKEDAQ